MTEHAVAAQVGALRERGRALAKRPRKEIIDALARVLESWRNPSSPWRIELESQLPDATGFRAPTVREGLERALAHWTGDALEALVARELEPSASTRYTGFEVTALLLAGSIPMPGLLAMLGPLALGSALLVRPASRDPVTARLVTQSIAEIDPELGRCIGEVHFPHDDEDAMEAFLESDCTVAYGSDPTIARIARRLPPSRRLVAHPHRLSLAVLGESATRGSALETAAAGIALDTALWDQQGCLSPLAVFVLSADAEAPDRVADALATALTAAEQHWPRGSVTPAAASVIAQERDTAMLRESASGRVRVLTPAGGAFTVVREQDCQLRAAPLHRFLRVHPAPDADALERGIAPYARHLAGVAHAGLAPDAIQLLVRTGASRLCAPGILQCPPLDWHHDGMPVLTPMARITDIEPTRG